MNHPRTDSRPSASDAQPTDGSSPTGGHLPTAQTPPTEQDQLDEALLETFPASDPISPSTGRSTPPKPHATGAASPNEAERLQADGPLGIAPEAGPDAARPAARDAGEGADEPKPGLGDFFRGA